MYSKFKLESKLKHLTEKGEEESLKSDIEERVLTALGKFIIAN